MKNDKKILLAAIACIAACIGDFTILLILGNYYPGYNQLKNTISALGASNSPVSNLISIWWIILGILFILFGLGFKLAFKEKGKSITLASWAIIIYGIGEGIGSGAFKADHVGDALTVSAYIHDFFGGIGIVAILLFPVLMQRIILNSERRWFRIISWMVLFSGISFIVLFSFRYSNNENHILTIYKGLWQRIFLGIIYTYFIIIAINMIKNRKVPPWSKS